MKTPASRTAGIGASAVGTSCRNISREEFSELSRIAGKSPDRETSLLRLSSNDWETTVDGAVCVSENIT